jgi:hypothetical protein
LIFIEGKKGFVFVGAACGNGFSNFHISLDGVKLSHSGMKYTKRTERELQAILKDAVVIERGHRLDNLDQVIGERGVLVYPDKENGKQRAMIYSKSEDSICIIESASLEHVLSFEQLYIRRAIKKGNHGGAGSQ